jgi:gamma-glutamyltranspeptidase / glutathione hydrolase
MPPPSSGGATLAEALHILENFKMPEWHSPEHIHLLIEAERRAFSDRNVSLGDPDFIQTTEAVTQVIDPGYAKQQAASINPTQATPEHLIRSNLSLRESTETTHYSIVDPEGNAVSNTYTLNGHYGCGVIVPTTGVLLNNEMDDFMTKPNQPNLFGLIQGEKNNIQPRKRMLSSMTPTIVLKDHKLDLVVGSPGGSTIITSVLQVISNIYDYKMPLNQAIAAPKVHHQDLPHELFYEKDGLSPATLDAIKKLGHGINGRKTFPTDYIGDLMGIKITETGLESFADPRRGGECAGF